MVDPECVPPEVYSARLEKSTTIPQVRARSRARAKLDRAKKAETAALARLEEAEDEYKTADAAVQQLIRLRRQPPSGPNDLAGKVDGGTGAID